MRGARLTSGFGRLGLVAGALVMVARRAPPIFGAAAQPPAVARDAGAEAEAEREDEVRRRLSLKLRDAAAEAEAEREDEARRRLTLKWPPPPPPSAPNVCSNECNGGSGATVGALGVPGLTGVCDDTFIVNGVFRCEPGTDCADCGERPVCTSCPDKCQAASRENALVSPPTDASRRGVCYEYLYQLATGASPVCNVYCNSYACGHPGCTDEEIAAQCTLDTVAAPRITAKPNATFPVPEFYVPTMAGGIDTFVNTAMHRSQQQVYVSLRLALQPISIALDPGSNRMRASVEYVAEYQWEDARMLATPCRQVISTLTQVLPNDAATTYAAQKLDRDSKYWLPNPEIANEVPPVSSATKTVVSQYLTVSDSVEWVDGGPANLGINCTGCARFTEAVKPVVDQPVTSWGKYTWYPFDSHNISLTLGASDVYFYNCADALANMGMPKNDDLGLLSAALLVQAGEWSVVRVTMGDDKRGNCALNVEIKRNLLIFFVKDLLVSILVMYGGLISMHLSSTEYIADRLALIITAMLILVTNMQARNHRRRVEPLRGTTTWHHHVAPPRVTTTV